MSYPWKSLLGALHLNDETLAAVGDAHHIEIGSTVLVSPSNTLGIKILDIADCLMLDLCLVLIQQSIQETDKEILMANATEQTLESEVGIKIDISLIRVHFDPIL